MRQEIIHQLKKEEFLEKVINMETSQEVKKAFKEENIDISDEELKEAGKDIYSTLSKISEHPELSDEEIEKISGGAFVAIALPFLFEGAKMAHDWYVADKNQQAAKARLEAQQLDNTWKGMISKNPGYATASVAALAVGTAYMAKVVIGGIRDGSLKRWFKSSEQ